MNVKCILVVLMCNKKSIGFFAFSQLQYNFTVCGSCRACHNFHRIHGLVNRITFKKLRVQSWRLEKNMFPKCFCYKMSKLTRK